MTKSSLVMKSTSRPYLPLRAADQNDIVLLGEEGPVASCRTSPSLTGVSVKSKSSMSLASDSFATVIWYLWSVPAWRREQERTEQGTTAPYIDGRATGQVDARPCRYAGERWCKLWPLAGRVQHQRFQLQFDRAPNKPLGLTREFPLCSPPGFGHRHQ